MEDGVGIGVAGVVGDEGGGAGGGRRGVGRLVFGRGLWPSHHLLEDMFLKGINIMI